MLSGFRERIQKYCDDSLIPHSRIHPLRKQEFPDAHVFVKREDETGFGISGFKLRKYASLLPFLIRENFRQCILLGGENSGNVTGLSQLLIQNGIQPLPWLKKSKGDSQGIYSFLTALLNEKENIRLLDSEEWESSLSIAAEAANQFNSAGLKTFVVPEGALCREAFWGTLTLWEDILQSENKTGIQFNHIFIDAGTGLTASGLAFCMLLSGRLEELNVLLLAGDEKEFSDVFALAFEWWNSIASEKIPFTGTIPNLHRPATAKSFGSVNREVLNEIKRLAREEGILTDPVYSAKMFLESRRIIRDKKLSGNNLLIHSGGVPSLFGFADQLK